MGALPRRRAAGAAAAAGVAAAGTAGAGAGAAVAAAAVVASAAAAPGVARAAATALGDQGGLAAAVALPWHSRADNRRLRAALPRPLAARIHAASSRSPDAPSANSISAALIPTRSDGLRRTSTRPLARPTRRGVPFRRPLATGWCGASTAATEGTPHTSSSGLSSTTSVPSRAARASAHSSTALHCQDKRFSFCFSSHGSCRCPI